MQMTDPDHATREGGFEPAGMSHLPGKPVNPPLETGSLVGLADGRTARNQSARRQPTSATGSDGRVSAPTNVGMIQELMCLSHKHCEV